MIALVALLLAAPPGQARAPSIEIEAGGNVAEQTAAMLRASCADIARALGAPKKRWKLVLEQARDSREFERRTKRNAFEAAATSDGVIWLQSDAILSRHDARAILRHECVHAWLRAHEIPPLPRVIEEALAVRSSGQSARLPPAPKLSAAELVRLERVLAAPKNARQLEGAVARASVTLGPVLDAAARRGKLLATLRTWSAIRRWDEPAWARVLSAAK